MTTRYTSKAVPVKGVNGVASGYEGLTSDLTVPSNGIGDIDKAFYRFFENQLKLQVSQGDETIKVPTIFASGEKWAQMKRNSALRDKNNALILPLTTIVRQAVQQSRDADIAGRGSNQHTGQIVIKRRFSASDRDVQNVLNGDLLNDPTYKGGGQLLPDRRQNVTEVICVPTPQYVTLKYELTFWTQYINQMNQIIEVCMSSYLPQTRGWRLEAENGYWFYAYVTSDEWSFNPEDENSAGSERLIKTSVEVEVPGFILASSAPGLPVPVRRYLSNPSISFDVEVAPVGSLDPDLIEEPFLGADDPTLPMGTREDRKDQRKTYPVNGRDLPGVVSERDPALADVKRGQRTGKWRKVTVQDAVGNMHQRLLRVKSENQRTGELVLDTGSLFDMTLVSIDD